MKNKNLHKLVGGGGRKNWKNFDYVILLTCKVSDDTKDGFFSESAIRFSDLQISKKNIPKNYPELEI